MFRERFTQDVTLRLSETAGRPCVPGGDWLHVNVYQKVFGYSDSLPVCLSRPVKACGRQKSWYFRSTALCAPDRYPGSKQHWFWRESFHFSPLSWSSLAAKARTRGCFVASKLHRRMNQALNLKALLDRRPRPHHHPELCIVFLPLNDTRRMRLSVGWHFNFKIVPACRPALLWQTCKP